MDAVRKAHPALTLIESAENLGFAGGANLGIPKTADLTPGGIKVDGKVSGVRHFLWAADS